MLLVGHNSGSKNYVQYFYTNALNNVISKKSLMFQRNELNSYENTEYEELNATQVWALLYWNENDTNNE
jgi:hypothetical protein